MKAPFPWFGGKRRVADEVWSAIGDVDNYVEPFAGSLAVLLERNLPPDRLRAETVNDADSYLANFWRALIHDPDGVIEHCDWPVNETDLFARHAWLVNSGRERIAQLEADPDWFDVKVAGWWLWGINSWIGSGWCKGNGPHRPHLGDGGQGVNRQRPHLGSGQGVNRQRPHLGNGGQGVNRQRPHLGSGHWQSERKRTSEHMAAYLMQLHDRLRRVRVCCGDWTRVVTNGALAYGNTVGVFLDPPYLGDVRTSDLYTVDDHSIAHDVREWCLANGDNPRYRIVLAGYSDEHDHLIPDTWRRHSWSASAAYQTSNTTADAGNNANRHNETLWLSPHCLNPEPTLF